MVAAVESRACVWPAASSLLLGLCCLTPSSAAAHDYHVFLCRIPYGHSAGRAAPVDGVTYGISGVYIYAGESCATGGSMYAAMDGGVSHSYASGATDTFTTPAGMTISAFTVWRYEADGPSAPYGSPASNLAYSPGPPSVQGLCAEPDACSSRGTSSHPLDPANAITVRALSGVRQIQWSAECGGGEGGTCPASGSGTLSSQYDVYAADIDLVDGTPPSVSGLGGPLVAGGVLSGDQAVSFDANDGQSGVYGGSLVVDGQTVVSRILDPNGGACQSLGVTSDGQRSFEHAQPCAGSLSASLTLDTGQLAPGPHTLQLIVEDAAGNQMIAYDGTITVAGSSAGIGPIGLGSPLALRGAANGTSASDEAKLTATWAGRARNGVRTGRYGAHERITGLLRTSTGQAITGAALDVYETPAYEGARTMRLPGVRTGPSGEWTLTLPRDISSCELRIAYYGHVNDTIPIVTATLGLRVRAGIVLRIFPRVTSVGHEIFFSGVLHGAPLPPAGKQLILEASSGGEWIQFDTIGASAKGRFRASYRFKFPGPVSYRFRVISPYEADFAFLAGASNVVHVYER